MTSAFYKQNRQALMDRIDCQLVVLTANGMLQRSNDSTFPFRQDSNFWYVTGINEPDLTLVIDGNDEFLILPPRDEIRNIFDGYIDREALTKVSGIKTILGEEAGWARLESLIKKSRKVGILQPLEMFVEHYDFYSNPSRGRLHDRLKTIKPRLRTCDIRPDFAALRVIKQPGELSNIQKAIDITTDTLKDVFRKLHKFEFEYEIEAAILEGFRRRGAMGEAFESVVASGKNSAKVHHFDNNSRLNKKSLLLFDVGAEVEYYAADISRVRALSKPTKRQTEIYQAAKEAQASAIAMLRPGVNYYDFEMAVEAEVGLILKNLGVIKNRKKATIRKYFPHAASHFMGLDVHDVGDRRQALAENMVIAVEPGFIIPEEGIGIRIEDDVLITKTGAKVLSAALPTTLG